MTKSQRTLALSLLLLLRPAVSLGQDGDAEELAKAATKITKSWLRKRSTKAVTEKRNPKALKAVFWDVIPSELRGKGKPGPWVQGLDEWQVRWLADRRKGQKIVRTYVTRAAVVVELQVTMKIGNKVQPVPERLTLYRPSGKEGKSTSGHPQGLWLASTLFGQPGNRLSRVPLNAVQLLPGDPKTISAYELAVMLQEVQGISQGQTKGATLEVEQNLQEAFDKARTSRVSDYGVVFDVRRPSSGQGYTVDVLSGFLRVAITTPTNPGLEIGQEVKFEGKLWTQGVERISRSMTFWSRIETEMRSDKGDVLHGFGDSRLPTGYRVSLVGKVEPGK